MISSIFGQSKPINYVIILGFLLLFYGVLSFDSLFSAESAQDLILRLLVLAILLFSIMVVNFIVKRNQISGTNDFTIFYYTLLVVLFPDVLVDHNAILSSYFLLLALRRLISLKSLKDIKLKLFDATFWIVVSSLFYDWVLLFVILVYICIYFYEPKNIRNWLVPILCLVCTTALLYTSLILFGETAFILEHYQFKIAANSNILYSMQGSVKILLYLILVVVAMIVSFIKLGKLGMGKIVTMRIITIAFFVGMVVTILKSQETISPVMITFFPASILFTKYVEVIKKANIKELTLILSIVVPFMIFIGELIAK
ncbi:MAG: DUF6427 family protein [Flavobacteriaceae bacterium]